MSYYSYRNILRCLPFFSLLLLIKFSYAQPCSGSIAIFPYNENFETSNGNYTTGGTVSDWVWGTPSKPVISGAGGGNRCWITGGLTGSSYNNSQNSWLQSPCFNFTSLQYPQISFKVFWETEKRFDGASFQYSTDGGSSWSYLGSTSSNSNCQGENWYNTPAITYLGNVNGWSGNIQSGSGSCLGGSGSGGWLTARHTLSALAGQSNVRFRFLFGAGSTCNGFDGFAIDDILIAEAPPNSSSFTSSCISDKEISFTSAATCASSYAWNFGDAASGANNISTAANANHIFSAAGTYTVSLTTNFLTGPAVVSSKQVVIIALTPATNWPGRCNATSDATLSVTATGSSTPYFYNWNTNPAQTTTSVNGVGAGTYLVTVSSANACSVSYSFVLTASPAIVIKPAVTDATCSASNGSIAGNVSGGAAPYLYTWSNAAATPTINNLPAGNYALQVSDANGCNAATGMLTVKNQVTSVPVNLGADINICPGQTITLQPGNYAAYLWQNNTRDSTFTVSAAGTYYVKVTNAAGCTGSDSILVKADCSDVYFPSAFTPNGDSRNDGFGPLGNLSGIKNYRLWVYNRYGQRIFSSTDPYLKWEGSFKNEKVNTGTFVWMATFLLSGSQQFRKGTVTLIR